MCSFSSDRTAPSVSPAPTSVAEGGGLLHIGRYPFWMREHDERSLNRAGRQNVAANLLLQRVAEAENFCPSWHSGAQ
jgi:hypothetical protein